MNKPYITAFLAIISLAFSTGAMAQDMSKSEYKAAGKDIAVEYKSAKATCASFAGNVKDICMAEAKGKAKVAKTELKTRYKPSRESDYQISVAKAQADYAVAREKCDDRAGKFKKVCVKEAKAALVGARSSAREQLSLSLHSGIHSMESEKFVAKEQLKISEPDTTANDASSAARMKAKEK
ncbi:MAG: hypothetical protein Q8O64_03080 [Sideroxyarcus sp.]|nr:hypothetical protein [Sideroxyarcus sp.]